VPQAGVPLSLLLSHPLPESLSDKQRRLLQGLYRRYPRGCALHIISGTLELDYPATEKLCEDVQAMDLVEMVSEGLTNPASVSLTKHGRDYCLRHGLNVP
jgi:hypothetical protein